MKTRPWPLVLLAVLQFLSPVGTVLINAWVLDVQPHYVWGWILERPFLQIFESLLLMPIAGMAIYWMKPWSYVVFFTAVLWSLGANLSNWDFATQTYSVGLLLLIYALQIGLALYFIVPSVRKTYFDASVRWWEAKRRYVLQIPGTVESNSFAQGQVTGLIQNISEGGVLFLSPAVLAPAPSFRMRFQVLGVEFETDAKVVYVAPQTHEGIRYGIQFLSNPATEKRFARLMKGLTLIGVVDRDEGGRQSWWKGMAEWVAVLFKTGKGLLPESKTNRRG